MSYGGEKCLDMTLRTPIAKTACYTVSDTVEAQLMGSKQVEYLLVPRFKLDVNWLLGLNDSVIEANA